MRLGASHLLKTLATAATAASILLVSSSSLPSAVVLPLPSGISMPFQQYNTAGDIPKQLFQKNAIIYGRVEKVIDGDTFRIRHYPFYPFSFRANYDGLLSEHTMSVRIYGVDAPEKGMPLYKEASDYASKVVDGKLVRVKLLRRDQYNRAVAKVTTKGFLPFTKNDISVGLAARGYCTLYTGGGAVYDNKRELLEKKIQLAQRRKRGIWLNGSNIVTPAEYKKNKKNNNNKGRSSAQQRVGGYAVQTY